MMGAVCQLTVSRHVDVLMVQSIGLLLSLHFLCPQVCYLDGDESEWL